MYISPDEVQDVEELRPIPELTNEKDKEALEPTLKYIWISNVHVKVA